MDQCVILSIEDDPSTAAAVSAILEGEGHKVLEAGDGQSGLQIFDAENPHLVMLDLSLPDISGLEVLKKITEASDLTPVIVISGNSETDSVIRTFRQGAWDYLIKPVIDPSEILARVDANIRRAAEKRRHRETGKVLKRLVQQSVASLEQQKLKLTQEIEERKRLERILEQAKREWEQIMDSLPDFVFLIDTNYRIIRLNKTMAKGLGKHPGDLVGRRCFEVLHGSNEIPSYCPHQAILREGKNFTLEAFDEYLDSHIEITATPYLDPDGTVIGTVCVVRDISHRKEAEKEREELHIQLLHAQKLEAVGRLAAGIAHEINTPVQYVGSNMDFFQESFEEISEFMAAFTEGIEGEIPEKEAVRLLENTRQMLEEMDWQYLRQEVPAAIDQAREGVARVTKIVRAMKEFSHPGSKEKKHEDVNKIIQTTVTIAKNEWKYSSDVVLDLDGDLPPVPCISDELGQVFLNMLVNAAHAISDKLGSNPEGDKGKIVITTRQEGGSVVITIEDDGSGIPQEIQDKIFEPFFTTKEAEKGTGQGLAISRDVIVEKHGGTIEVESEPGRGTRFTMTLPLSGS